MAIPELTAEQIVGKMLEAVDKLKDYTCVTEGYSSAHGKEGWRSSRYKFLKEPEMVWSTVEKNKSNYKSRSMPGSKYLLKDGKVEAKLTGLLSLIPLKVRADDKLARWHRGERLDQSHVVFIAKQLARDIKAGNVSLAGTTTFEGKEMYVIETTGIDPSKNSGISSQKIAVDPDTFICMKIEKFEKGNSKAVSSWEIKEFKLNTGLSKNDFRM